MTKLEAQQKMEYHRKKWQEYQKEVERMEAVFDIPNMKKPFSKYGLNEIQQLFSLSATAYAWFQHKENRDCNIYDYNNQASNEDKLNLAR